VSAFVSRPGPVHEGRVRTLEALATLAGFLTAVPHLPDGRTPDVVRISTSRRGLFLGEAKASEGPGDREALARLARYVIWWEQADRKGPALLVVCCDQLDRERWASVLSALAAEVNHPAVAQAASLGGDDAIAWLASSSQGAAAGSQSWRPPLPTARSAV
jgi:hypothetical protein